MNTLNCPHCGTPLDMQTSPETGTTLCCPACSTSFAAPAVKGAGLPVSRAEPRKLLIAAIVAGSVTLVAGLLLMAAVSVGTVTYLLFRRNAETADATSTDARPLVADTPVGEMPATPTLSPAGSTANSAKADRISSPVEVSEPGVEVASLPIVELNPVLRYGWKAGLNYQYQFSLRSETKGAKSKFLGTLNYKVGGEHTSTTPRLDEGEEGDSREGSGTAFVVHRDGLLVTCAHVVRGGTKVKVSLGGRDYSGDVVGLDERHDLALIRISATDLPVLKLADSDEAQLAEEVRAIGFPLSNVLGTSVKVTRGAISGIVTRNDDSLLQIDAAINPGNSGGPLVNDRGEVLGVNSAVMVGESVSNVGFAVPARYLRELLSTKGIVTKAAPSGPLLDGPSLARAVSPSVAFVKVTLGAGQSLHLLEFMGNCKEAFGPGAVGKTQQDDRGQVLLSPTGEVLKCTTLIELPFLMRPLSQAAIERLPAGGEREWQCRRIRSLTLSQTVNTPGRPAIPVPPWRFDPRRAPQPGSLPTQTRTIVVIPALEQTRYRIIAETADTIEIEKTIELSTLEGDAAGAQLQVSGNGKLVWDKKLGIPQSHKQTLTMVVATSGGRESIPLEFEINLTNALTDEERAKIAVAARPTQGETPRTGLPNKLESALLTLRLANSSSEALSRACRNLTSTAPIATKRDEVSTLLDPLLISDDATVCEAAFLAAAKWATPKNIPTLLRCLQENTLGNAKEGMILDALGATGGSAEAAEAVAKSMNNRKSEYSPSAVTALMKMGTFAEDPVWPLVESQDTRLARDAIRILGIVGTAKSLERFKTLSEIILAPQRENVDLATKSIQQRLAATAPPPARPGRVVTSPLEATPVSFDKPAEITLPGSAAGKEAIVKSRQEFRGLLLTQFDIPPSSLTGEVLWSPSGDAFFMVSADGLLRRVAMTNGEFTEERRLDMARRVSWLAESGLGLLVAMRDLQEVWLVHPATLDVIKRVPAPNINRVLSHPGLKFALGTGTGQNRSSPFDGVVVFLDLEAGVPIHQQSAPIKHARLTSNGKRYFAQGGIEQLMSFRLEDQKLTTDQATVRIAQNGQNIFVSSDDRYVCLPSGGGNYGAGNYATFVYPTDNLIKPEFVLESGAYPRCVGFAPASKLVFTQNHKFPLLVYSETGIKLQEYELPNSKNRDILGPRQFAVHPSGKQLLILSNSELTFVKLPEK